MRSPFDRLFGIHSPFGVRGGGNGYNPGAPALMEIYGLTAGGWAGDWTDDTFEVLDPGTPANDFSGAPSSKLTVTGEMLATPTGAVINNTNYAKLASNLFPWSASTWTFYIEWEPLATPTASDRLLSLSTGFGAPLFYLNTGGDIAFYNATDGAKTLGASNLSGVNAVAITRTGGNIRYSINGGAVGSQASSGAFNSSETVGLGVEGSSSSNTAEIKIRRAGVFSRILSDSELRAISTPRTNPTYYPSVNILVHGDSMAQGQKASTTANGFADELKTLVAARGLTAGLTRRGIPGQGWNYIWGSSGVSVNLTDDAALWVDANKLSGAKNWLVLLAGGNDIALDAKTGVQTAALFDTYLNARLTAGWSASDIVVCTMLPRSGTNTERAAYNSALISKASTYGFKIARLDQITNLGADGDNTNTTYYHADQVHPNDAGHDVIAQAIYNVMYP